MNFLIIYLSIGFGLYAGASLARLDTFKDATIASIVRGLILGIFFWPITPIVFMADLKIRYRTKVRQSKQIPTHTTYTITVKDQMQNQHLNDRTRMLWLLKKAGAPIEADGLFLKFPTNYTWSRTDDHRGNMTWTFYGPL